MEFGGGGLEFLDEVLGHQVGEELGEVGADYPVLGHEELREGGLVHHAAGQGLGAHVGGVGVFDEG
ncbi:MAG TPA: hypothetical protein VNV37_08680 [Solirubrobacteraceae bacterium]|nr:hypothetical protein [Solirubrobacteraceae bacterium]